MSTPLRLPEFAQVVCLSGSTRFRAEFEAATAELTLDDRIVLSVGVYGHADGLELSEEVKARLDALHLRKIDLADAVVVIAPGDYVGESTRREITYAQAAGKLVVYRSAQAGAVEPHPRTYTIARNAEMAREWGESAPDAWWRQPGARVSRANGHEPWGYVYGGIGAAAASGLRGRAAPGVRIVLVDVAVQQLAPELREAVAIAASLGAVVEFHIDRARLGFPAPRWGVRLAFEPAENAVVAQRARTQLARAQSIRAEADAQAPRVHPNGEINTQHVAIELTLRERLGLPAYIAELDGPGAFRPAVEPNSDGDAPSSGIMHTVTGHTEERS